MKVFITGANGFLGRHLIHYLSNNTLYEIIVTAKNELKGSLPANIIYESLDITNEQQVNATLSFHLPQIIIHTAAMSKPDECEDFKEKALLTNTRSVDFITKACLKHNIHLVFTSSDFIFGNDGEVTENTTPNPLSYYGQTKLWAEEIIKQTLEKYSIIRPVLMYGRQYPEIRGCFLHWVQNNLQSGNPINVVNDQLRKPTFVEDVCVAILRIIENKHRGVFNICGDEVLTPYQMAVKVAKYFKYDINLITPVTNQTFKEKALRATNCMVSNVWAKRELGFMPISFEQQGLVKTFSV
jgi:dTDP-4-dehydrorhamnose reductase